MRKTSSLPKPLKTLLLSLAVSDFGVGLLAQPLFIVRMVTPTYFTHITFNVGQIIFTVASFFSVVAINVDRFLAVIFISDIRNLWLTSEFLLGSSHFGLWVYFMGHYLCSWVQNDVTVVIIFGVCFIITGIANCKIYFTVRRHKKQMQAQQIQVAHTEEPNGKCCEAEKICCQYILRISRVFSLLFANLLRSGCQLSVISPQSSALTDLLLYAGTLTFLNWSLNPVIYCWKMRHIRHAIIDTLRHIFPSQN